MSEDPLSPKALVATHWARIKAWALYECGDRVVADDVCQEVWLRMERTRVKPDPERNLLGWLRSVVRSAARDLAAKERRMQRPAPDQEVPRPDPARTIDLARGADRMLEAFATLSPRQREAVDLVDRQGLRATEAAEVMGITASTVRVLVHQARAGLREHLFELHALVREA